MTYDLLGWPLGA